MNDVISGISEVAVDSRLTTSGPSLRSCQRNVEERSPRDPRSMICGEVALSCIPSLGFERGKIFIFHYSDVAIKDEQYLLNVSTVPYRTLST